MAQALDQDHLHLHPHQVGKFHLTVPQFHINEQVSGEKVVRKKKILSIHMSHTITHIITHITITITITTTTTTSSSSSSQGSLAVNQGLKPRCFVFPSFHHGVHDFSIKSPTSSHLKEILRQRAGRAGRWILGQWQGIDHLTVRSVRANDACGRCEEVSLRTS